MAGATLRLVAPLSGVLVPLDRVPDPVFARRLVGDGVSIDPLSHELLAPCAAEVLQIHRAGHAVTLAANGLEVMIHVGLDTVELKGKGFTPVVKAGDQVAQGDLLLRFDSDFVATHARSLLTQVVVANSDRIGRITPRTGTVRGGRDVILDVVTDGGDVTDYASDPGIVESEPIVIHSETGLHARPAALVAAAARQFRGDVRIVKHDREANARSVVSIMALEVNGNETVKVVARGEDAGEAVNAIARLLVDLGTGHGYARVSTASPALAPAERAVPGAANLLRGVSASPGVAAGLAFQLRREDAAVEEFAADPNHERRELEASIASAHLQLEALQTRLAADADPDRAAIFAAHQELLEDPEVLDAAAALIRRGATAAFAWREAYTGQAERLVLLRNQLLAGRAADLRDVGRRVLHLLVGREDGPLDVPADSILVCEDLAPSDAASLDRARVRGFCTTMGSATSHVAILARALGIPAVAAIDPLALDIPSGTRVVLDGDAGTLHRDPTAAEEAAVSARQDAVARSRAADNAVAMEPAVTTDGHRVEVVANIGDAEEAVAVAAAGGEGVGLLRTEFLFMDRRTAPNEAEQTAVYQDIARSLGRDRILVIRTLDVGGDKPLSYLPIETEANPFLGERGIRLMVNEPEILRTQVRAILRASAHGKVAVMFPMIATIAEWRFARELVERERLALGAAAIKVGIMVETPSAALLAERFAETADFFSIGTNDLTQYTLAMDRTNPRLAAQLDALHPAVLQLIERTVTGARAHGRWVGLCGALAGDPVAIPVLIGLGVHELSVPVPALPAVKARIRGLSLSECRATASAAVRAADAAAVRELVSCSHGAAR